MSLFQTSAEELEIQEKKADRRRAAAPSLEGRRVRLSEDPAVREIVKDVQSVVNDMRFEYPEIMGLGMFGSLVKGYSLPDSDVDGFLYVDIDQAEQDQENPKNPPPGTCRAYKKPWRGVCSTIAREGEEY